MNTLLFILWIISLILFLFSIIMYFYFENKDIDIAGIFIKTMWVGVIFMNMFYILWLIFK